MENKTSTEDKIPIKTLLTVGVQDRVIASNLASNGQTNLQEYKDRVAAADRCLESFCRRADPVKMAEIVFDLAVQIEHLRQKLAQHEHVYH